jgi:membrane protein YqaA with SNARE-associated domain
VSDTAPEPAANPAPPPESPADSVQASKVPQGGLLGAILWPLRLLKALYAWVIGWADSKWGLTALLAISFSDSSFFPVPPDPLLIAMCLGKRVKSIYFGSLTTVASVLGGVVGWLIGRALFPFAVGVIAFFGADAAWFGTPESVEGWDAAALAALPREGEVVFYPDGYFHLVQQKFSENAFLAYFTGALSPIPYKVFTIAGGVFGVSLWTLIVASIAGRGLRYMSIAVLIRIFGDKIKPWLERYFEWITVAVVIALIAFVIIANHFL